jgi:hypothetical protein
MNATGISCGRCAVRWLPAAPLEAGALTECPGCGVKVRVRVFPALVREVRVDRAQPVVMASEAACLFHPTQRASVACDQCGCFLCALCDLEFGGRHLCPACLESAEKGAREEALERGRTRHDHVVGAMVFAGLLFGCGLLGPVLGPAAMGYTAWAWNKTPSLVERSRLRMALACVAALGLTVWGVFIWVRIGQGME